MTTEQQDKLEVEFIDRIGLHSTLEAIANICYAKSSHIAENWGPPLAGDKTVKTWASFGRKIDNLAATIKNDSYFLQGLR